MTFLKPLRAASHLLWTAGCLVAAPLVTSVRAVEQPSTLSIVSKRGVLICGVSEGVAGFSAPAQNGEWSGIDIDFCRALAAAVLGDAAKIQIVSTTPDDRFRQLTSGNIDVLTRNTSFTMQREIEQKVLFPGVLYFDGQGFMISRELGLSSPDQLAGARICVISNTTSEVNAASYFAKAGIRVDVMKFASRKEALHAYETQTCDVRTADRSALFGEMEMLPDPARHMVFTETISKEPLGPVVRSDDRVWADIVRWTLSSLITAEELELHQSQLQVGAAVPLSIEQRRFVEESGRLGVTLGLPQQWVAQIISSVGNYAEIFDRNLGSGSPFGMTRGANALWKDGGLMYAPPMP